ncbi:MAG TPA: 3-phosphoshikimate 1-carboxyvinyltransferase [Gammaproteobacteria bacterium]|jgi:3-phosphoshikimate 1-carboxyvinyltransferase|nr:3-phosphoshikimate 1-carboxyvinyltransferase [Gammaproteobacteria bacterium]|tara:strand:- start:70 stop:1389 length:1320 start_codon:yes stop_codon:yes gene_type:complete
MNSFIINGPGVLRGSITLPGDKSISHRAVILGAIAQGRTTIEGMLESEDVLSTVNALRNMGVKIVHHKEDGMVVEGVGLYGLKDPGQALNMGNSGTAMRLMAGVLVGQSFPSTLVGDDSLSQRPMARVVEPLRALGADITVQNAGYPPIQIKPVKQLRGVDYVMPVASAQVKSAFLLAALCAEGVSRVKEPTQTRDHTERMLRGFGHSISQQGDWIRVIGGMELGGAKLVVPGDLSSAAFFIVGAAIATESEIILKNVGVNPTRTGVIEILQQMGARIDCLNKKSVCGEPTADLVVSSSPLRGVKIEMHQVARAIDEFPILSIAAACARGKTTLHGAEELRVKESDRIRSIVSGLSELGISVEERADGYAVTGGEILPGEVNSLSDHRIAMAFAIAGLVVSGSICIHDTVNVRTSFPEFVELASSMGMPIQEQSGFPRE